MPSIFFIRRAMSILSLVCQIKFTDDGGLGNKIIRDLLGKIIKYEMSSIRELLM